MPRSSEANQQIREAQRAKILKSARKVFARKGMAATITDIAAEAQVSIGLAYRYFTDKDAIFSELVRQMMRHNKVLRVQIGLGHTAATVRTAQSNEYNKNSPGCAMCSDGQLAYM